MHPLIHDWNKTDAPRPTTVLLDDETLRDGLQSPSVRCPTIDEKLRILHLIDRLGIETADLGLPGAGPYVVRDAECWTLEQLLKLTEEAIGFAVGEGLPVMYVTEDTTRADPDTLRALYSTAIRAGARRVCIADTVGHATPYGAAAVVRFIASVIEDCGGGVGIDWHRHLDRDLAFVNTLAALEAGATRLHGAAIGIGERGGNTPMGLLLVNLG